MLQFYNSSRHFFFFHRQILKRLCPPSVLCYVIAGQSLSQITLDYNLDLIILNVLSITTIKRKYSKMCLRAF